MVRFHLLLSFQGVIQTDDADAGISFPEHLLFLV